MHQEDDGERNVYEKRQRYVRRGGEEGWRKGGVLNKGLRWGKSIV